MHTDEFEISLLRELCVCKNTIYAIKKSLVILERKHNKSTDAFLNQLRSGTLSGHPDLEGDYQDWQNRYESLMRWEELERQYQEALQRMKI